MYYCDTRTVMRNLAKHSLKYFPTAEKKKKKGALKYSKQHAIYFAIHTGINIVFRVKI